MAEMIYNVNPEWTTLPQTNGEGLDDFQYVDFISDSPVASLDWFNNATIATGGRGIERTFGLIGYFVTRDACFRSGVRFDYEYIRDNVPQQSNFNNAPVLFAVTFPESTRPTASEPDSLVIKAVRSTEYLGRKIGTLNAYGDYINVSLLACRRTHQSGGLYTDEILSSRPMGGAIYMANERDVSDAGSYLEFFYPSELFFKNLLHWDEETLTAFGELGAFIGFSTYALVPTEACYYSQYTLWAPTPDGLSEWLPGNPMGKEWNPDFGDEGSEGGYNGEGSHDFSSDNITRDGLPSLSAITPGFLNVYKVSSGLLNSLGRALFPSPDPQSFTDVIAAIYELCVGIHNGKLIDYIVDCHIVPVNVAAGVSKRITVGGKELVDPSTLQPYSAPSVSSSYVSVSCGGVSIPEAFGNFLDYTVRCKLYLPFFGYVDIPPEYWNGGTISVEYAFNIIDGSFVAFVKGRAKHSNLNSLIGQYTGGAITHIPVSGRDYSQVTAGITSTAIGAAGTVMGGLAGGVGAIPGAVGVASNLGNVLNMKPNLVSNGAINSSSAMMMNKTPYLIIEYPTPQFSSKYPKEKGLPLNVAGTLGQFGGMTIAENPVLDGIPCTEREKERIRAALKTGLIFR